MKCMNRYNHVSLSLELNTAVLMGGILVPVESNALVGGVRPLSFLMCNSVHHDDEPKATATGISLKKEAK